ncbi:MAG: hypothetical protein ABSF36_06025 [Candidatus Methanomethylicaceae archaeon]|jgi:D-glycero-alpha-D-manno-heptose-7-phosphate kinase
MIVTKTPFRLTLGGGGTDLKPYYSKFGGFVVTTALNKHMYIVVKNMFEEKIRLSYSLTEIVDSRDKIKHPLVREALKMLNLSKSIEIVSIADVPSKTGLGSSGSFTVGLLHALHTFKEDVFYPQQLAEEACKIQMEILKEAEGKQDPYVAAFGRVISLDITKSGRVKVSQIKMQTDVLSELQNSMLFFYTGIQRSSSDVLSKQTKAVENDETKVLEAMHHIKEIGFKVKSALVKGDIEEFGRLQNEHWLAKKNINNNVSNGQIDKWYQMGVDAGALGGKIMGAGGGGFLMFCSIDSRDKIRKAMAKESLKEVHFRIGEEGSKVLINL